MKHLLKTACLLPVLLLPVAHADEEAEDAIDYRQATYQVIKWNFSFMAAMAKGEKEYDAEAFQLYAERTAAMSTASLEGYIKGTDRESVSIKTGAKPNIWEDWDGFKAATDAFIMESGKLAELAKKGEMSGELKKQFAATGKTCKSCHDEYRQK